MTGSGDDDLTTRPAIDRLKGTKKDIAVLLTDAGNQIYFPMSLLPKGVRTGESCSITSRSR